jgi:hypothetical protein
MQAVPIATEVLSSNSAKGEVYSIQHHVIKYVIAAIVSHVIFVTESMDLV